MNECHPSIRSILLPIHPLDNEGAPALQYGNIVAPSPRPSPLRGEGVKRRAYLT
jgi:hypothetical protein